MRRENFNKLRRARDRILWEKFYFNRGKSIWSDLFELLTLTTIVGLFTDLLNRFFGADIPVRYTMAAIPFIMILYWITGRLDFKHLHLIQKENEIGMEANPALYQKVKDIKKISKDTKKMLRYMSNKLRKGRGF